MAKSVTFEAARTLAFGSLSGTYADVGAVTANAWYVFTIFNDTDVAVTVSPDDGTTDAFDLPAGASVTYDLSSNRAEDGQAYHIPKGSQFQAKDQGSSATSGKIIVMGLG